MRKILILALVLGLVHGTLIADGPPMDEKGNVKGPFVTIKLNDKQLQQVSATRIFELTKEQKKKLPKTEGPKIITMEVITSQYRDCTCGMGFYGIWNKSRSVDVPLRRYAEEINQRTFSQAVSEISKFVFFIDLEGRIYNDNSLLTKESLRKRIKDLKKTEDKIGIAQPPFLNKRIAQKAQEASQLIRDIAMEESMMVY